jgi:hypothetical protein
MVRLGFRLSVLCWETLRQLDKHGTGTPIHLARFVKLLQRRVSALQGLSGIDERRVKRCTSEGAGSALRDEEGGTIYARRKRHTLKDYSNEPLQMTVTKVNHHPLHRWQQPQQPTIQLETLPMRERYISLTFSGSWHDAGAVGSAKIMTSSSFPWSLITLARLSLRKAHHNKCACNRSTSSGTIVPLAEALSMTDLRAVPPLMKLLWRCLAGRYVSLRMAVSTGLVYTNCWAMVKSQNGSGTGSTGIGLGARSRPRMYASSDESSSSFKTFLYELSHIPSWSTSQVQLKQHGEHRSTTDLAQQESIFFGCEE